VDHAGGAVVLDDGHGPVDQGHLGCPVAAVDTADDRDAERCEGVEDCVFLGEARDVGCVGAADEDGIGLVEEAVETHPVEAAGDAASVFTGGLDIDEEALAIGGEARGVEVGGSGEVGDGVDATADETAFHGEVLVGLVPAFPAGWGFQFVGVHLGVFDVVDEALAMGVG